MLPSQTSVLREIRDYFAFLSGYIKSRFMRFGKRFEGTKDIIVAFLIVKRGKYSGSFLNTSFFLLMAAALIGGPVIAQNNPFISDSAPAQEEQSTFATDIYSLPFRTQFSEKPRDGTIDHVVKSGDTLASLAKTYEVSVDSIKWASNLKSDTIRPGDTLTIPPVSGVVHTVKAGESIYTIAKRYGASSQAIVNYPFNDFEDLDTFALKSGQLLIVPDGVPPQEKRPIARGPQITQISGGQQGSGSFIWPTSGDVSQYPIWYHMALDIANRGLPPVLASDTGTVSYAGCISGGYGCHVIIAHGNGFSTLYGHLSRIDVGVGQGVGRGQNIGQMGSTGRSTGPHLHFEIRKNGALQNPLGYLK